MSNKSISSGLKRLERNAKRVSNTKTLTQDDLFPNSWVIQNTSSNTWSEFVANAPWDTEFDDDSVADLRDEYVAKNSKFSNWEDMLSQAATDSVARSLFQGL